MIDILLAPFLLSYYRIQKKKTQKYACDNRVPFSVEDLSFMRLYQQVKLLESLEAIDKDSFNMKFGGVLTYTTVSWLHWL